VSDDRPPDPGDVPTDIHPRTVEGRFGERVEMRVPDRHNPQLHQAMEWVNANDELYALWVSSNVNAIERLHMSDHGPVHVKIVMNLAVRLLRLLMEGGVEPSVAKNYGLEKEDAEVIVALAALLHDVGMSIHREDHEEYSLFLAHDLLRELLPAIYELRTAAILQSEILHAIIGHRSGGTPLTLEAGVVRIADALDMAKGRSRIPFEAGSTSIHSVSAQAVDQVLLERGEEKPVRIRIELANSAGIFQLDQLFRNKLKGSGLEPYIELEAFLEGETEKRLFREFQI
jgi:metal-dependent HD superfamily phosphatase/phosphodiesterase